MDLFFLTSSVFSSQEGSQRGLGCVSLLSLLSLPLSLSPSPLSSLFSLLSLSLFPSPTPLRFGGLPGREKPGLVYYYFLDSPPILYF